MICVSIGEYGYDDCLRALRKCERASKEYGGIMAEIRLDLCQLSEDEVHKLFISSKIPLIATARRRTKNLFYSAVDAKAAYVDVDALSYESDHNEISALLRYKKTKKILSYHDYQGTPQLDELKKIYLRAVSYKADIIKIVTYARTIEDSERVLNLYDMLENGELGDKPVPLIAFSMGNKGCYSRVEALSLGAPFTYCALSEKGIIAQGQMTLATMLELISNKGIEGDVCIPCSKSVAQRAIIGAVLAQGESEFHNFSRCKDTDAAIGVAKQVGAKVYFEDDTLFIRGIGFPFSKARSNKNDSILTSAILLPDALNLFVGESGLLSRLCVPIAAQMGEGVTITGEGSLLGREMYGCKESLELFKAKCILTAEDTLPAVVSGPLRGSNVTISGKKGSQLISGLLMALPLSKKDSVLTITDATSVPYIMLTLDVVRLFGISIDYHLEEDKMIFNIPGKQKYHTVEMNIEGDWSSAANFIVAGSIFGNIFIRGLNMNSHQADRAIFEIVKSCGAGIEVTDKGLFVKHRRLHPFEVDVTQTPDLFPILSVLAAYCEGVSTIRGIDRLKNKESNRTNVIYQELGKMGVDIELEPDVMIIRGVSPIRRYVDNTLLKGGTYLSYGDHRIAMALTVASVGGLDKIIVDGLDSTEKSFPTFEKIFASVYQRKK